MANPLTSDFDVVIQVSEELLDRYMILQYFSDESMRKIDQRMSATGMIEANANFKILIPSLSLHVANPTNADMLARIILPFEGTLSISQFIDTVLIGNFYLTGIIFIDTELTKTTNATGAISIDIDFSKLTQGNVKINFSNTNLTPLESLGLQQLFALFVLNKFQSRNSMNIIRPQASGLPFGILSLEGRTKNSANAADPVCLSLFTMISPFNPTGNISANFTQFLKADYTIAISETIYNQIKPGAINQAFGLPPNGTFPVKLSSDNSITVNSADLVLQNGYLEFSGSMTKAIGAIDVDADVTAKVKLDGNLVPGIYDIDVDLPWWIDLVNALIPIIGTQMWLIIKDVIEKLIGKQVSNQTSIQNVSIFTNLLNVANLKGHFPAEVKNYGCDISTNGFTLYGDVRIFTYVGNRRSKELHVFNDNRWLDAMTGNYEVYYERYEDYLAKGYNGCYYCLRQLNTG
jgi:hypothetical protein